MPAPATIDELLGLIRRSELFDPERLNACVSWAMVEGGADGPNALAAALVRAGLLTKFHAEQFLLGKYRGFTIGKYRVMERLGFGGMGIVYLCEHQVMGHKVAIKVLPTSKSDNPAALGRFYREARAAGALDHPNLVRAHDVDREGNIHYLVMDYIDGASLHQIVLRSGPLAPDRAAHYIGQSALGLEHARQAGLVHRDIKPANIIIDRTGTARILDLGLARFYDDEDDPLTLKYDECNVLGTADYVSPEQALNSHEVDTRADIYSMGCTFYYLLTGRPPFPDGKAAQKLIWHQTRAAEPIHTFRSDVPKELAAMVVRMLAKKPADRYQTPGELADILEPWLAQPAPIPTEIELPATSPALARSASQPEIVVPLPSEAHAGAATTEYKAPAARGSAAAAGRQAVAAPPRVPRARPADVSTPPVLASAGVDTAKINARKRPPRPDSSSAPAPQPKVKIWTPPPEPERVDRPAPSESGFMNLAMRLGSILILGILATAGARWLASHWSHPSRITVGPSAPLVGTVSAQH